MTSPQTKKQDMHVSKSDFKQAFSQWGTGISVLRFSDVNNENKPVGIIVNSLTSVCLEPPTLLFCLDKASYLASMIEQQSSFTVSILSEEQKDIAAMLLDVHTARDYDRIFSGKSGNEGIQGALSNIHCEMLSYQTVGDHYVVYATVSHCSNSTGNHSPLLYFDRQFHSLSM